MRICRLIKRCSANGRIPAQVAQQKIRAGEARVNTLQAGPHRFGQLPGRGIIACRYWLGS